MPQLKLDSLAAGLTDAEKEDLEMMFGEFRRQRRGASDTVSDVPPQTRVEDITQRLADLTEMLLAMDRRMGSLVEIIRLSHQKSELMGQRLDAVIAALKKGHKL